MLGIGENFLSGDVITSANCPCRYSVGGRKEKSGSSSTDKGEILKKTIIWTMVALLIVAAGWYRWKSLHKDNQSAIELWGRMDKAAQKKLATEISRSFIRLHRGCRRAALTIDSSSDALVIKVKCADGSEDNNISNVQLIGYIESGRR